MTKKKANKIIIKKSLQALHLHFPLFVHMAAILVYSTKKNDLFFNLVDDVSIWRRNFNLSFLYAIARTILIPGKCKSFESNYSGMIVETQKYILK